MKDWEFSIGTYPGILIGFRSYQEGTKSTHVVYIPFVDLCFTVWHE
jgi:hypothetical protein